MFVREWLSCAGAFYWGSGDWYTGQWRDALPHGKGCYRTRGGACYDGDWWEGQRHGNGVMTLSDGTSYTGGEPHHRRTGSTWCACAALTAKRPRSRLRAQALGATGRSRDGASWPPPLGYGTRAGGWRT